MLLAFIALIALLVGIPMGVYTALRPRSFFSQVLLAVSLAVGLAVAATRADAGRAPGASTRAA